MSSPGADVWWGECVVCEDGERRYLYRDGRCTAHSPLARAFIAMIASGKALRAPAVFPRGDRGPTPIIASGTPDDARGDEA